MNLKAIQIDLNDEKLKETASKICNILDASPLDMNECHGVLCLMLAMQGLYLAKKGLAPPHLRPHRRHEHRTDNARLQKMTAAKTDNACYEGIRIGRIFIPRPDK